MPEYRFTPEARDDLQGIIEHTIVHWGQAQAHKYIDGLEALAARLAETPRLGADRSQMIEGLISFPYGSHVLYYLPQEHGITIIRVLHQRMDARPHVEKTQTQKD